MTKIRPTLILCIISFVIVTLLPAGGRCDIVIIKGARKASIAVADITVNGRVQATEQSREMTAALRFDLEHSGWFTTDKDYNSLRQALVKDPRVGTMNREVWRARTDAELLIKADLRTVGGEPSVTCYVFSLISNNIVFKKVFKTRNHRFLIHSLADEIVKKQTGRDGIARTRIAFVANKGTKEKHLYVMDYDGHNARKITNLKKVKGRMIVVAPDWGPKGDVIYFTSYHNGYPYLYKIDFKKSVLSAVSTFPGLNASVSVSPNGSELALCLSKTGSVEIHKMTVGAKTTTRLTRGHGAVASVPRWSPDGGRIAFVSNKLGQGQIFVMSSNGRNEKRLIKGFSYTTSLDWSPKGDLIAFSATRNRRIQLFVADIKTGKVKQLTSDRANNSHPSFAPDGIHLVYTKEKSYSSDIHMIDVRDLRDVRITKWQGDEIYPSWSPVPLKWSF